MESKWKGKIQFKFQDFRRKNKTWICLVKCCWKSTRNPIAIILSLWIQIIEIGGTLLAKFQKTTKSGMLSLMSLTRKRKELWKTDYLWEIEESPQNSHVWKIWNFLSQIGKGVQHDSKNTTAKGTYSIFGEHDRFYS